MKLLLFPLLLFLHLVLGPAQTTEGYTYELTVNAQNDGAATFALSITGYAFNQKGEQTPFRMQKKNLKTPYLLTLKPGHYKIEVESKAKEADIVSKVQGIKDGVIWGSASSDDRKAFLKAGPGGNYAARGE